MKLLTISLETRIKIINLSLRLWSMDVQIIDDTYPEDNYTELKLNSILNNDCWNDITLEIMRRNHFLNEYFHILDEQIKEEESEAAYDAWVENSFWNYNY
jgi:hypothetical protein